MNEFSSCSVKTMPTWARCCALIKSGNMRSACRLNPRRLELFCTICPRLPRSEWVSMGLTSHSAHNKSFWRREPCSKLTVYRITRSLGCHSQNTVFPICGFNVTLLAMLAGSAREPQSGVSSKSSKLRRSGDIKSAPGFQVCMRIWSRRRLIP